MSNHRELKKGSTPILILAVLAESPLHGYAIAREIEKRSKNALKLGEGALYPALRTLEHEGLIVGNWEVHGGGPARRVYTLTEDGRGALAKQTKEWSTFTDAVNSVLLGSVRATQRG